MHITLELSPELEIRLRESIVHRDAEAVFRLLVEVLTPTVETLLRESPAELSEAEFEAAADQLADELAANLGAHVPSLPDSAISREGIYEDHP